MADKDWQRDEDFDYLKEYVQYRGNRVRALAEASTVCWEWLSNLYMHLSNIKELGLTPDRLDLAENGRHFVHKVACSALDWTAGISKCLEYGSESPGQIETELAMMLSKFVQEFYYPFEVQSSDDNAVYAESIDCTLEDVEEYCQQFGELAEFLELVALPADSIENKENDRKSSNTSDNPVWDSGERTLRYQGLICKKYRQPAANQVRILRVFQEEGWPSSINDPLLQRAGVEPKHRLRDTVKALNQKLQYIRFECDGTGEGIIWIKAP